MQSYDSHSYDSNRYNIYVGNTYNKAIPVFFECFHNPGMHNSFDLKTIAGATATVYRKIVKAPKPRKETKIKHQRAAW